MKKYLGVDVGTSTICGVLCVDDDKNGATLSSAPQILSTSTVENDANLPSESDESFQAPARILTAVERTLERFLAETASAETNGGYSEFEIGLTGQMHGILYLDADGNALSPLATWRDRRADRLFDKNSTYVDVLTRKTGRKIASGYGLATHFYNVQNGLVPPKAVKIATIADFIAARLSGASEPILDPSNAASLGFFDVEQNRFDLDAVRAAEIDPKILPKIASQPQIVGFRDANTPVWTAIGDNQASFWGAVDAPTESVHTTVGTSAQLSVFCEKFRAVETLETRPFPGGGFLLVGAALCGGSAWTTLRDFFAETLAAFGAPVPTSEKMFATLGDLAEKGERRRAQSSNAARLRVATTFNGTRLDPEKRGRIEYVSSDNFSPETLAAGFLDGIAEELWNFYRRLPDEERQKRRRLVGSGNGLRKNAALARIVERKFGLPLEWSPCETEAAYGAVRFVQSRSRSAQE